MKKAIQLFVCLGMFILSSVAMGIMDCSGYKSSKTDCSTVVGTDGFYQEGDKYYTCKLDQQQGEECIGRPCLDAGTDYHHEGCVGRTSGFMKGGDGNHYLCKGDGTGASGVRCKKY